MGLKADIAKVWRKKKREFTNKRGRMGRSPFFANFCLVFAQVCLYVLALHLAVDLIGGLHPPRAVVSNIYNFGVGVLFFLLAFGTRPLRLKRLRDMGVYGWVDLPFMLLLLSNALGPVFALFDVPFLRALNVVNMPENVRDVQGLLGLVWMLLLILAPSKHRANIFTCRTEESDSAS